MEQTFETTRTTCRITRALVESIVHEKEQFDLATEFKGKISLLFNNSTHSANGIAIIMKDKAMDIKISLKFKLNYTIENIIEEIKSLQEQIKYDVYDIIGIGVDNVHVTLKKAVDFAE